MRDHAGLARRHGAVELAHDPLGYVVGLDFVADDQFLHEWKLQAEVAADDTPHHALVGQMIEPPVGDGADAGGMDDAKVAW